MSQAQIEYWTAIIGAFEAAGYRVTEIRKSGFKACLNAANLPHWITWGEGNRISKKISRRMHTGEAQR